MKLKVDGYLEKCADCMNCAVALKDGRKFACIFNHENPILLDDPETIHPSCPLDDYYPGEVMREVIEFLRDMNGEPVKWMSNIQKVIRFAWFSRQAKALLSKLDQEGEKASDEQKEF